MTNEELKAAIEQWDIKHTTYLRAIKSFIEAARELSQLKDLERHKEIGRCLIDKGWVCHAIDYWSFEGCESMSLKDAFRIDKGEW